MPKQCVSREQALRGYTVDAAFAAFQDKKLGQIADGFFADFVALDRDILDAASTPDEQIWQTAILGTWSGGEPVWRHACWAHTHGLAALRACVEAERAKAPPLESTLERLQRLSAAHGDGCPF